MTYPPPEYPPPNGYPPPPAGYRPPPAYPAPGYGPPPPGPPPGYPPAGPPPMAPPPLPVKKPVSRGSKLIGIALVVMMFGCGIGFVVIREVAPEPQVGDCLTELDTDFFARADIVDCSDPDAVWEVVAQTTASSDEYGICRDHPDGESYVNTSRTRTGTTFHWAICAVPR